MNNLKYAPISQEIIKAENKSEIYGKNIIILEETESTNNYAKELATNGAENGTVVLAESQTMGRGRLGRRFESPKGTGIYMSVIIRPKFHISYAPLITSAVAVAVAEAVESQCDKEIRIKWINDLYLNGKKICGILTESVLLPQMKNLDYAIIGIGINVYKWDFPEDLKSIATSIEAETGKIIDRNKLCGKILEKLEYYLENIENRLHFEEYRRRELLTGNEITANYGNEKIEGFAVGVDDNANLIIKLPDGNIKNLTSGEANLCRLK